MIPSVIINMGCKEHSYFTPYGDGYVSCVEAELIGQQASSETLGKAEHLRQHIVQSCLATCSITPDAAKAIMLIDAVIDSIKLNIGK